METECEHIIAFKATSEGIHALKRKKDRDGQSLYCKHWKVWLDEDRRMIQCRECKCWFEPYDWIVLCVRRQLWKFETVKEYERLISESEAKLVALRREEANCKARIRRAKSSHTPA